MFSKLSFIYLILIQLYSLYAHAYPEFIGYKYNSCLTCHYNGQGHGAINDYGRALWSAEIADRVWARDKTNEELSTSSGFLGSTQLPWWLRPGVKFRQLWYKSNPGSSRERSDDILMQAEANLTLIADKDYKVLAVLSYGFNPTPGRIQGPSDEDEWISRNHYIRWQATESMFIYTGMMDIAYGIRIVDHTAFSRGRLGLGQADQAHGVMFHYVKENYEFTFHPFVGNLLKESDLRTTGMSGMVEYDLQDHWRVGSSALFSSNEFQKREMLAFHSKNAIGFGSAILLELGFVKSSPFSSTTAPTTGYYLFSEVVHKLTRGYHLFVTGETYKSDMSSGNSTDVRTSMGLLAFPMSRVEFRVEGQNTRSFPANNQNSKDIWNLLFQIHLSL